MVRIEALNRLRVRNLKMGIETGLNKHKSKFKFQNKARIQLHT